MGSPESLGSALSASGSYFGVNLNNLITKANTHTFSPNVCLLFLRLRFVLNPRQILTFANLTSNFLLADRREAVTAFWVGPDTQSSKMTQVHGPPKASRRQYQSIETAHYTCATRGLPAKAPMLMSAHTGTGGFATTGWRSARGTGNHLLGVFAKLVQRSAVTGGQA